MRKGAKQPAKIKGEKVSLIKEKIKDAKVIYFTDFTGLSVRDITALRNDLRQAKTAYFVVKNRLARLAFLDSEFGSLFKDETDMEALFNEPVGLAIGFEDPIEPGKIMKKNAKLKVKGALIEKRIYRGKEYDQIVALPSRSQLLSQLVLSINQPIANLVYVLQQLVSSLVYSLVEIRKKKTGGNDVK